MPDFDRLHELARKLAELTAPGNQEPGLASWCMFVGEDWREIARMWGGEQTYTPDRRCKHDLRHEDCRECGVKK
jgi:hypothetical protein